MYSFDLIYVQAWSRPYIRSFDHIYVQVDLIYLTLDLIYQILTIYLKTDFCPIWRVILKRHQNIIIFYILLTMLLSDAHLHYRRKINSCLGWVYTSHFSRVELK